MLVYFTENRDTPGSVAAKFAGGNNAGLADRIRSDNANTRAALAMPGQFYAPRYPIVIDIPWQQKKTDVHFKKRVIQRLEHLTPMERHNLAQVMKNGHDIKTLAHAAKLTAVANTRTSDSNSEFSWSKTAEDWAAAAAEFKAKRLEHLEKAVDSVKEKLITLKKVTETATKDVVHQARAEFKHSFERMQSGYQDEIRQFKVDSDLVYRKYWKLEQRAVQQSIEVLDTPQLEDALRVGKCLKFVAEKFFLIQIADDVIETENAYRNHGPWVKMAIEDTLEVTAAVGISIAVGIAFVGGGWAVMLGAATVDVAANVLFDSGSDWAFSKI